MSVLERPGELARALFTTELRLRHVDEAHNRLSEQVKRLDDELQHVRERVVRLETQREADRAQMAAELARFKAEVERAALRGEMGPRALGEHGG